MHDAQHDETTALTMMSLSGGSHLWPYSPKTRL